VAPGKPTKKYPCGAAAYFPRPKIGREKFGETILKITFAKN
jgi:hypothetical protein